MVNKISAATYKRHQIFLALRFLSASAAPFFAFPPPEDSLRPWLDVLDVSPSRCFMSSLFLFGRFFIVNF
jgi:hypothetical protein